MVNDPVIKASYAGEMNKLLRKDTTDGDKDKEADFYVIKKAPCAAVLTENFFYDNKVVCWCSIFCNTLFVECIR